MNIIYEDNHLIAINKPAGLLVQGDKTGDRTAVDQLKKYIKEHYGKPGDVFLGVIHRLDRPATGVCIFGRTSKGLERMNRLFAERQIEKKYWVVTSFRPDPLEGHLTHFILKDNEKNTVKVFDALSRRSKDAKQADLNYRFLGEIGKNHLLEVELHTGRPHQIRAQLAHIGCSVRGDLKYGYPVANPDASIHLHCRSLSFEHPVTKEKINIVADPPKNQIWDLFGFAKDLTE